MTASFYFTFKEGAVGLTVTRDEETVKTTPFAVCDNAFLASALSFPELTASVNKICLFIILAVPFSRHNIFISKPAINLVR